MQLAWPGFFGLFEIEVNEWLRRWRGSTSRRGSPCHHGPGGVRTHEPQTSAEVTNQKTLKT